MLRGVAGADVGSSDERLFALIGSFQAGWLRAVPSNASARGRQ